MRHPVSAWMYMPLAVIAAVAALAGCEKKTPPTTTRTGAQATTPPVSPAPPSQTLRIAVVPKGTTHDYWKSVHAGAVKAMSELSLPGQPVTITFRGPEKEDDR